jgi:UDP-N-acetylmuramoylalanine--D-glutamate ligase
MDRYESLDEYTAAKQRIFQNCETAITNRADAATVVKNFKPTNTVSFALTKPNQTDFGMIGDHLALGDAKLISASDIYLQGLHHWENSLAALALGQACGIPMSAMLQTLRIFKGLKHRCQLIKKHNEVAWYNDSMGTNEGAAKAAIEGIGKTIKGKVILIAGGVGKGADFKTLIEPVKEYVSHAILLGEAKQQLSEVLQGVTQTHMVSSLKEAVQQAKALGQAGDAVLLSPACASFDMFQNFEKRGEAFETAVMEIFT